MSRPIRTPNLPTTPGTWLACYRYRMKHEDQQPYSPEDLGVHLGVSGDTVRRWEMGRATPLTQDLLRFAEAANLRPLERAFLVKAFSANEFEAPPDQALFRDLAQTLLSEPFPAYLYDSLFYVRGWNSYMDIIHRTSFPLHGANRLERMFEPVPPEARSSSTVERRRNIWVREFWYETARLCGSRPYIQTVEKLIHVPSFASRWTSLALEYDPSQDEPVGAPNFRVDPTEGIFRATTSSVGLPPTYFMREFVPVDANAWAKLEQRREQGKPQVSLAEHAHWSEAS